MNRLLDPNYVKEQGLIESIRYYKEKKEKHRIRVMDLRLIPSLSIFPNELECTKIELKKAETLLEENELELKEFYERSR